MGGGMIDLTPLLPLCCPSVAEAAMQMLGETERPDVLIAGRLGRLGFVVTLDGWGDCEASISLPDARPTAGHALAFFRKWGIPMPKAKPRAILGGKGLHWVISRGTRQ